MPFMIAINPKLYEKTCCSLLIINFAVFYSKYEYVCDVVVYSIQYTVYIVYNKLLSQVTSLQYSLQLSATELLHLAWFCIFCPIRQYDHTQLYGGSFMVN